MAIIVWSSLGASGQEWSPIDLRTRAAHSPTLPPHHFPPRFHGSRHIARKAVADPSCFEASARAMGQSCRLISRSANRCTLDVPEGMSCFYLLLPR